MPNSKSELDLRRVTVGAVGALLVLLASTSGAWLDAVPRAWLLTIGFSMLTASCVGASRPFLVPALLGLVLVAFCGISATVAVPQSFDPQSQFSPQGFAIQVTENGFKYAVLVTGLGGLAMMLAALATASLASPPAVRRSVTLPRSRGLVRFW